MKVAEMVQDHLMDIVEQSQKMFYNKFQEFVKAQPDSRFEGLLDINMIYDSLMNEFVAKIQAGEIQHEKTR
jgi:hypothetical protein